MSDTSKPIMATCKSQTSETHCGPARVRVKYSTCTYAHIYQYLVYLSSWCMEMSKYMYLYLTKKYLVLSWYFPSTTY